MFDLIDFKAVLIIALIFTPLEQLLPLEALLTADIGFYLAHRAFHAVPFLWRFQPSTTRSRRWTGWPHRVHPVDQIQAEASAAGKPE